MAKIKISEWKHLSWVLPIVIHSSLGGYTQGSETSHYLQEEKEKSIPWVAA